MGRMKQPKIYTLSAYETSAQDFFESLKEHETDLVVDVRLKNSNQLCGFTKRKDLEYLIPIITGAKYVHDLRFAPDPVLLERYLHKWCSWDEYAELYQKQMQKNGNVAAFKSAYGAYHSICILGTATKKRRSHSEALVQLLTK
jgi:hypothetical protein